VRDLKQIYGDNIDGTFPDWKAKNDSAQDAHDGTPFEAGWIQDLCFGWTQKLLDMAGMTPNGEEETATASQVYTALASMMVDTMSARIVDGLTSTDSEKALSAAQGKALNNQPFSLDNIYAAEAAHPAEYAVPETLSRITAPDKTKNTMSQTLGQWINAFVRRINGLFTLVEQETAIRANGDNAINNINIQVTNSTTSTSVLNTSDSPYISGKILISGSLVSLSSAALPTITSAGTYFVYVTPAGVISSCSTLVPTWSSAKKGFYNGTNRAILRFYFTGAADGKYNNKMVLEREEDLYRRNESQTVSGVGYLYAQGNVNTPEDVVLVRGRYRYDIMGGKGGLGGLGGGEGAGGQIVSGSFTVEGYGTSGYTVKICVGGNGADGESGPNGGGGASGGSSYIYSEQLFGGFIEALGGSGGGGSFTGAGGGAAGYGSAADGGANAGNIGGKGGKDGIGGVGADGDAGESLGGEGSYAKRIFYEKATNPTKYFYPLYTKGGNGRVGSATVAGGKTLLSTSNGMVKIYRFF
jgi:hypothetical protein